jgi:metallo-beta-lactamase class B
MRFLPQFRSVDANDVKHLAVYPLIKANIEALGFKTSDIKIITATHGHFDHVGDLAAFQKDAPGAKTYMSERDAPALESGGNLDYRQPEGRGVIYDPVKVDVRTKPGDHIKLGNTDVTVLRAFGHTRARQASASR